MWGCTCLYDGKLRGSLYRIPIGLAFCLCGGTGCKMRCSIDFEAFMFRFLSLFGSHPKGYGKDYPV